MISIEYILDIEDLIYLKEIKGNRIYFYVKTYIKAQKRIIFKLPNIFKNIQKWKAYKDFYVNWNLKNLFKSIDKYLISLVFHLVMMA